MKQKLDTKPTMVHSQEETNTIPNSSSSVKLKYVKLGYHYLVSNAMYLLLTPIFATTFSHLSTLTFEDFNELWKLLGFNFVLVILLSTLTVFTVTRYMFTRPRKVYLVDFACYNPEPERRCTRELFMELTARSNYFSYHVTLTFQRKIMEKSGYGPMTCGPKGLMKTPQDQSTAAAREETETVMFGAIDDLLAKTGVKPRDIGILIVNSSLFHPTPSLSAAVVNHYKLN